MVHSAPGTSEACRCKESTKPASTSLGSIRRKEQLEELRYGVGRDLRHRWCGLEVLGEFGVHAVNESSHGYYAAPRN